jgi:hypothetical protein
MKTKKLPRECIPFLLSGKLRRGDFVGFSLGVKGATHSVLSQDAKPD